MNEIFEVNKVKTEFLQNIGPEYTNVFSERQLEMSVYMLNDFCNALAANSLVLIRIEPEQIAPPQYQQPYQPPVPNMGLPPEYQQRNRPIPMPEYQQPVADPFQEMQQQQMHPQQVQRQVQEMNAQLPRAPPPKYSKEQLDNVPGMRVPPQQDVDMAGDKPKTFAEKIKEMRGAVKKPNRINPEDDN